jgi:hypothetical protein
MTCFPEKKSLSKLFFAVLLWRLHSLRKKSHLPKVGNFVGQQTQLGRGRANTIFAQSSKFVTMLDFAGPDGAAKHFENRSAHPPEYHCERFFHHFQWKPPERPPS